MVAQTTPLSSSKTVNYGRISTKQKLREESTGYCLSCGAQVSYCGKPFSAEIACPKCGAVNIYVETQQPTALKKIGDRGGENAATRN